MNPPPDPTALLSNSDDRSQRLDEVVTAFLKAVEAGAAPDPRAWLTRYSDLAPELEAFFTAQQQIERLAAPRRPPTPPTEPATLAPGEAGPAASLGTVRYFGDYELLKEIARG